MLAGWATGLGAGEGDWTLDYSFFTVSIDLTDAGHGGFIYCVSFKFTTVIFVLVLNSASMTVFGV